jgi:plasmid stabilization system protein ParE
VSRIRFRTEAARDVEEARAWYDANRRGLGDEFVLALERVLDIIGDLPEAFPETPPPFRRALLGRFPYAIYYQIERDVIDVVGCLGTRQSPEVWDTRRGEA